MMPSAANSPAEVKFCETHDRSRKRMDAKIPGGNAKGEGNGEVAECDRNAVTESFAVIHFIGTVHNENSL